jgi:hypothetical protein
MTKQTTFRHLIPGLVGFEIIQDGNKLEVTVREIDKLPKSYQVKLIPVKTRSAS